MITKFNNEGQVDTALSYSRELYHHRAKDGHIFVVADFHAHVLTKHIVNCIEKGHPIGILVPLQFYVNHAKSLHKCLEEALKASPVHRYDLTIRAHDILTGAESIAEITITKDSTSVIEFISYVGGPVDKFPVDLVRILPGLKGLKFYPPQDGHLFYENGAIFSSIIKSLSWGVIQDAKDVRQIWVSPKVLVYNHGGVHPSFLDMLAVLGGELSIEQINLIGNFDHATRLNLNGQPLSQVVCNALPALVTFDDSML